MNKYLRSLGPLSGLIAAHDPIIRRPDGFSPSIAVMQISDLPAFSKLALLQRPGIYVGVRYPKRWSLACRRHPRVRSTQAPLSCCTSGSSAAMRFSSALECSTKRRSPHSPQIS
ncbi:hypothetical protein [Microvirga aerophila]|uniref:hypothetical protein n=1 Tax=Microvirga aerophila TaxID=670291 RepID=UPI0035A25EA3